MPLEALPQALQGPGTLAQPAPHPQDQAPAGPATHPVADVVAQHCPSGGGGDHPDRIELTTAGGIAPKQGHRFTGKRQAGIFEQHRPEDHAIAPMQQ